MAMKRGYSEDGSRNLTAISDAVMERGYLEAGGTAGEGEGGCGGEHGWKPQLNSYFGCSDGEGILGGRWNSRWCLLYLQVLMVP
ncbi:uncharacterized protein A4U43_C05F1270 [Asparagus officinalis]|uniref:Uncharacterized protein n=1 Tax=Asparagus officinalis TaxID=4686 RepID=A0A5P1ENP8_ASPOF|nr:uncharacterized protein A4U43_C05F1270 [Asparagus officinalis]